MNTRTNMADPLLITGIGPSLPLCNVKRGKYIYMYMEDLVTLEFSHSTPLPLPPKLLQIRTPLKQDAWASALASHPDRVFSHYLVQGVQNGFHIGSQSQSKRKQAQRNRRNSSRGLLGSMP